MIETLGPLHQHKPNTLTNATMQKQGKKKARFGDRFANLAPPPSSIEGFSTSFSLSLPLSLNRPTLDQPSDW